MCTPWLRFVNCFIFKSGAKKCLLYACMQMIMKNAMLTCWRRWKWEILDLEAWGKRMLQASFSESPLVFWTYIITAVFLVICMSAYKQNITQHDVTNALKLLLPNTRASAAVITMENWHVRTMTKNGMPLLRHLALQASWAAWEASFSEARKLGHFQIWDNKLW